MTIRYVGNQNYEIDFGDKIIILSETELEMLKNAKFSETKFTKKSWENSGLFKK